MASEQRFHPRFEPPFVDAVILFNQAEIRGKVLDSSISGMAIALPEDVDTPQKRDNVKIYVTKADCNHSKTEAGSAEVLRCWQSSDLLNTGKGFAIKFNQEITENIAERYLLCGIQQNKRLESQAKLVPQDIAYLGDYRRDLIGCQMKLFILTLTVGIAIAGAYFGLTYHTIANDQINDADLRFWRTMIAALPGCLAIACALMVAQKSISIQRIDAYLLLLKEYCILDQFPREYRGWESAYRKMRNTLNSNNCKTCGTKRKCGELKVDDTQRLKKRGVIFGPKVDLYHIIVYMSFFSAFGLSLVALLFEIKTAGWETTSYMLASSAITALIIIVMVFLGYIFYHLRRGKYSVDVYIRCWIDLLNRCRWQV